MLYHWLTEALFWKNQYDEVICYGEKGLKLLGDDTECMEAALMNTCIAYSSRYKGDSKKHEEYINRNIRFVKNLEYTKELRIAYDHISQYFLYSKRDINNTLEWIKDLEIQARSKNDIRGIVTAILGNSDVLFRKGDLHNALVYFRNANEMSQNIGDNMNSWECYYFIITICTQLGNASEAEIALEALGKIEDRMKYNNGTYHSQLMNFLMLQNHWDKAVDTTKQYIEIQKNIGNQLYVERAKFSLGYVHMRKGDYNKALDIFHDFADKNVQSGLFILLERLEYTYKKLGKYDDFLNFCKDYREKHAEAVRDLPLQQWYLEPAQISNELSNPVFNDDFNKDLDPSWTWVDVFNDCHCEITENGIEIHASNGRDLYWPNMSAPRFVREITGDFAVQVCVSPATKDKPQIGGLLIWKDDKNYVCFERGRNDPYGFWFYGCINKEEQMVGRGLLPEESEFTYIRLERNGNEISAYCSIDNENWLTCGKLSFPVDDPIQVGIYAIGMIDRTTYCGEYREGTATLFRNFRILTKG